MKFIVLLATAILGLAFAAESSGKGSSKDVAPAEGKPAPKRKTTCCSCFAGCLAAITGDKDRKGLVDAAGDVVDVVEAVADGMADGKMTADEIRVVVAEAGEVAEAVGQARDAFIAANDAHKKTVVEVDGDAMAVDKEEEVVEAPAEEAKAAKAPKAKKVKKEPSKRKMKKAAAKAASAAVDAAADGKAEAKEEDTPVGSGAQ